MNLVRRHGWAPRALKASSASRPIFVVIGMHRSGTSLCSNVLHTLGVDMADDPLPGHGNTYGHWERPEIMQLQDEMLEALNRGYYSSYHDFPLPPGWWRIPKIRSIVSRLTDFVGSLSETSEYFGFKDPRTARLLPAWRDVFRALRLTPIYVICVRNPADVSASLASRDALDPRLGEYRWLDHTCDCFRHTKDEAFHIVRYENWFERPHEALNSLRDFLKLDLDVPHDEIQAAVDAVIRPDENHGVGSAQRIQLPVVRHFYGLVSQASEAPQTHQEVDAFVETFTTFKQLLSPFETLLSRSDAEAALHQRSAREREEQLAEDHARLALTTAEGDVLRLALSDQEKELGVLRESLSSSQALLERRERETRDEQARLAEALVRRDEEIGRLHSDHDARAVQAAAEISTLRQAVADRDLDLQDFRAERQRLATELAKVSPLAEDLADKEEELAAVRRTYDARVDQMDAQIQALRETLTAMEADLVQVRDHADRQRQELDAARAQLDNQTRASGTQLDALTAAIMERDCALDLARAQLAERSAAREAEYDVARGTAAAAPARRFGMFTLRAKR